MGSGSVVAPFEGSGTENLSRFWNQGSAKNWVQNRIDDKKKVYLVTTLFPLLANRDNIFPAYWPARVTSPDHIT